MEENMCLLMDLMAQKMTQVLVKYLLAKIDWAKVNINLKEIESKTNFSNWGVINYYSESFMFEAFTNLVNSMARMVNLSRATKFIGIVINLDQPERDNKIRLFHISDSTCFNLLSRHICFSLLNYMTSYY